MLTPTNLMEDPLSDALHDFPDTETMPIRMLDAWREPTSVAGVKLGDWP